ncbi:MAG: flagellar protein FliS [Ignavibacteriae bacterium]|nr:flagellar protein FliS [Ignavibacteriota bacterium]
MQAAQQTTVPIIDRAYAGMRVNSALNTYRNEQMMNLSPVEVIHRLYAVAIQAIKKDDSHLATRAINELITALNFEYQEISLNLYRLYQYAKHCLRQGRSSDAIEVLEELRSAWGEAFKL